MKKIDEINNYLTNNSDKIKDKLINNLVKKFNISKDNAETYYYSWKKEFMKSENISVSKEDAKKIAKEVSRQLEKEIEEVKEEKEVSKGLEIIEKEVVKIVKAKGIHGIYEAKTGVGVALENEVYKIAFKDVNELEVFCNEFKRIFEEI